MPRSNDDYLREVLRLEKLLRACLHRFAPRHADLEDLLQETYARLFAIPGDRRALIDNLQGFAVTTARNIAKDWIRRRQVVSIQHVEDIAELSVIDDVSGVEDLVHCHRELMRIAEVIAQLPERCRRVFTLRRVYGFSQKEIAQRLDISEGTVEQHLVKGMRRCAQALDSMAGIGGNEVTRDPARSERERVIITKTTVRDRDD